MYTSFFGLNEKPFSITPDPRYLFMSERHSEALAHLIYGVTDIGGFLQLTGEVGTGKTTLVRSLLASRMPDNADVAVVLNSQITTQEFLVTICEELSIPEPKNNNSIKALTDSLNRRLLKSHANGRKTILIIDEAQNLSPIVLEQIRLLTNLETAKQKLLQIILIGQPELRDLLKRNDLRQLSQRITGRYHLEPLSKEETVQYIEHRLRVAGALIEIFDDKAKKEIFYLSKGIPRIINIICDRSLLGAYSLDQRLITKKIVCYAANEISGRLRKKIDFSRSPLISIITLIVIIIFGLLYIKKININSGDQKNSAKANIEIKKPPIFEERIKSITLSEKLVSIYDSEKRDVSVAALFELWGLSFSPNSKDSCLQAADAGLECIHQRTSWNGLRQLNRPAILKVIDKNGNFHELVLVGLNGDMADLSIDGKITSYPISEVTNVWFGDFMMLWQPPNGISTSFSSRSSGPDVLWLRKSFAKANVKYLSDNMENDLYDENLEEIVKQFQRDNRLEVDGLVGKQTLIILNTILNLTKYPRLLNANKVQE
tara:strand:+ start:547 stop:2178 length:1632 start_codon:yes stop_codon:yes gene_type:complete